MVHRSAWCAVVALVLVGCTSRQSDQPAPPPPPQTDRSEPEPQTPPPTVDASGNIVVDQETFERAFTEIEQTIDELNQVIARRDFRAFRDYLTEAYIATFSDPAVLAERSQSQVLLQNGIVLKSFRDYFEFVVVPSRANARFDDIVFVDERTVAAMTELNNGVRARLYLLSNVDGSWKLDVESAIVGTDTE